MAKGSKRDHTGFVYEPKAGDERDPGTAWDIEASHLAEITGRSLEDCYDEMIATWLWHGDHRPLFAWLVKGYRPGPLTSKCLAWSAGENTGSPYQMVLKRRDGRGGRKPDMEASVRDRLWARRVDLLEPTHGREAAIRLMLKEAQECGAGDVVSRDRILEAHEKYGKGKFAA